MLGLFALAVSFSGSAPFSARADRPALIRPARIARAASPVAAEPEVPLAERVLATAPYLLPACDGYIYGGYIYQNTPVLGDFALLFAPAVNAFESIPFSGLALFIGLSIFSRSANLSRFVRFNIQQAIVLDIALVIPSLFQGATQMFPAMLQIQGSNFIFYCVFFTVAYSAWCNSRGVVPDQVPIISEAAASQVGPF